MTTNYTPGQYTEEGDEGGAMYDKALPPPGFHLFRLLDFERKSGPAADYLNVKVIVLEGDYRGHLIYGMVSFSQAAGWKLDQFMAALNVTQRLDLDSDAQLKKVLKGLVGKAKTDWEEYQGEKRTKIQGWYSVSDEIRERWAQGSTGGSAGGSGSNGGAARANDDLPSDDFGADDGFGLGDDDVPF